VGVQEFGRTTLDLGSGFRLYTFGKALFIETGFMVDGVVMLGCWGLGVISDDRG
jgi:hypothetical protein